jgi:hypothetical protein
MRARETAFRLKIINENMRLRRTLTAISETPMPRMPYDAADKLDRMKRLAAFALKRRTH